MSLDRPTRSIRLLQTDKICMIMYNVYLASFERRFIRVALNEPGAGKEQIFAYRQLELSPV